MSEGVEESPIRVVRPVPLPRQFAIVGGIHSFAIAAFLGFLAIIALKLGSDFVGVPGDSLPFALAWGTVAFGVSFLTLWTLHYWKLIQQRGRTSYLIFPDRVEVRRDGSARPVDAIPLGRTVGVQSWTGPLLRPHGLATLTLIEEEPPGPSGHSRHVFHPLPNVPDPEAVADLIRDRMAAEREPASAAG